MTTSNILQKVVFLGTPDFAVPTLELLSQSSYKPLLVITQPDKKQGRNMRFKSPPVKLKSIEHGIETMQPEDINEDYVYERLSYLRPDLIITVAYGGFLKKKILRLPVHGCINLHPSLLPKYRGSSPVNYTLFNNDEITGNSVIRMVSKMDSGPIIYQSRLKVKEEDNATTLLNKLSIQGSEDILKVLEFITKKKIQEVPQNDKEATYSRKISKEDTIINWGDKAVRINCKIRGLSYDPGAVTYFRGNRMKILKTSVLNCKSEQEPGTITNNQSDLCVATGDNDLMVSVLQPAGKKFMNSREFLLGARVKPGEKFSK